jgi:hypothetical protein
MRAPCQWCASPRGVPHADGCPLEPTSERCRRGRHQWQRLASAGDGPRTTRAHRCRACGAVVEK